MKPGSIHLSRAKELRAQIESLEDELQRELDAWAHAVCPHSVGEVINLPDSRRNKMGRIRSLNGVFHRDGKPYVRIDVKPLKIDGSDSSQLACGVSWEPA